MKFAILSDIHGNIYALKEAVKNIEKENIDSIILCGDYITDIPRTNEVIDFIKEIMSKYKTYIIKGNREEKVLNYADEPKEISLNNENILYTYEDLTKENLEFIKSLPESCMININGMAKIYVSHIRDYNNGNDCKYKIFGHSHRQHIFSRDGIKYINPGSIGLPTDGDPRLKYCILTIEKEIEKIDLVSIPYDYSKAIKDVENAKISKSGIRWGLAIKKLIESGLDYPRWYLDKAIRIGKEYGIGDKKENLPIELWAEARKSLNIK